MTQMFHGEMGNVERRCCRSRAGLARLGVAHQELFDVALMACIVAVWVLALLSLALALPLEAISAVAPNGDAAEKLQRPNDDA